MVSDLSGASGQQQRIGEEAIKTIWRRAAGKGAGQRSHPTSLKKGKLVVAVGDSSLLYDLTLRKRQILEALEMELPGRICEIQFRIGETGGEAKSGKRKTKNEKRR